MLGLSFELGVPVHKLNDMPEKVLWQYQLYGQTVGFPFRRLELYLAQIAMISMQIAGAKNVKLSDLMFNSTIEDEEGDDNQEALLVEIGFNPRNK